MAIVYVWHHDVHQVRADCRLVYMRLSFGPEYETKLLKAELAPVFQKFEVRSYISYELLGEFDVLLRLWLPTEKSLEELEGDVESRLKRMGLWQSQSMAVRWVSQHWAWSSDAHPKGPDLEALSQSEVAAVRDINEQNLDPEKPSVRRLSAGLERLVDRHLLRRVDTDNSGIRFFIHLGQPARPFGSTSEISTVANEVRTVCRETVEKWEGAGNISLYVGTGSLTSFFISADAPVEIFYEFVRALVFGLRRSPALRMFHIRPYTHVAASREFASFSEDPAIEKPIDPLKDVIGRDESEVLEFKGTLSIDVKRLLHSEGSAVDKGREDDIIKAVCGLLNGRNPGRLVIGVLEPDKFGNQRLELAKLGAKLIPKNEGADPENTSVPLKAILLGIEFEHNNGSKFANWDSVGLHLKNILKARIDPGPMPYLTISAEAVDGNTLVSIAVVSTPKTWFYASEGSGSTFGKFWVREGAGTRELVGADAANHKRVVPRIQADESGME